MDAPPAAKLPAPRRLRRLVALLSWLYFLAVVGAWMLLYLADLWWPATFFLFAPRWALALPLAVLVPAALLRRRRSLIVLALSAAIIAGPLMGLCVPWGQLFSTSSEGFRLRVLTCNMHYRKNLNSLPLDDLVAGTSPDVVALQEWPEDNASAVLADRDWHVHRTSVLFLASRYPIVKTELLGRHSDSARGAVMRYDLQTPIGIVHFFSVHLASPRRELYETAHDAWRGPELVQASSDLRWEQSENLAHAAGEVTGPVVLAGDFNTPPESAIFRRLWDRYTDAFSAAGWGWGYTYLASRTTVRIDHVLAGPGWSCAHCRTCGDIGSPHRPVLADLVWRGSQ